MQTSTLRVDGSVLFWSLATWSHRPVLEAGLTACGFGRYVPEARGPGACLKHALEHVFSHPNVLVRPLKNKLGFHVLQEERGESGNTYASITVATIDKDTSVIQFDRALNQAGEVVDAYNRHLDLVQAGSLSAKLVDLVDSLGGVRLRPTGAIYWLPENRLNDWLHAACVVEGAAAGGGGRSAVYCIRHKMDEDALRAVKSAYVAEIQLQATSILEAVDSGAQGARALKNREEEAQALRHKIGEVESMLDVTLVELHAAVDQAEEAACKAVLLQSLEAVDAA